MSVTQQRYICSDVCAVLLMDGALDISIWSTSCSSDSLSGTSELTHLSHTSHTPHTSMSHPPLKFPCYYSLLYIVHYNMWKCASVIYNESFQNFWLPNKNYLQYSNRCIYIDLKRMQFVSHEKCHFSIRTLSGQ